jgi:hypothetical protein
MIPARNADCERSSWAAVVAKYAFAAASMP